MFKQVLIIIKVLPILLMVPALAAENDTPVSTKMKSTAEDGLLTFTSDDGAFSWKLDGRLQFDSAAYFSSDNNLSNGIEARRVRFAIKGRLQENWRAELDVDFADNEIDTKDAWIAYDGFGRNNELKLGNFKAPFSLEEVTSSRMVTFMERALPNRFAVGRRLGASYTHWEDNWRVSLGLFGQELDALDESENDESFSFVTRANYLPYENDQSLWLIGGSFAHYTPDADSDDEVRFRARPETHVERDRLLNTGRVEEVDSVHQFGFETAYQQGPFLVQGEYIQTDLNRKAGNEDATYDGWYLSGAYIITGERRPYNPVDAEFSVFTPNEPGAWEVAARVSALDLNDSSAGVTGGSADQYTLGLNYYPNRNIRIMFNYSHVNHDANADGDGDFLGNDDFDIAQVRLQVVF